VKTRDDLRQRIDDVGLTDHAEALMGVASAAIRLTPRRMEDDGPLGVTRLGGLPDLPPGVEWPVVDGVLLEFVGQFRLEDLASYDEEKRLPQSGMLYFFFDGMLTGYDRGEGKDRRAVLTYDGPLDALERRDEPAHNHEYFDIFYPCVLDYETVWMLPPEEEIDEEDAFFPPLVSILTSMEEGRVYRELRKREFAHQLLGHPAEVQGGEMRLGVVKAQDTEGRFVSDRYGNYEHRDELVEEMRQWRLLAQFMSDRPTGMDWGCGGMIYFWIREADLAARCFDRVYGKLEST
jgi:uncharacterized protein YwqG